ncbi:MAG: hypothetical protein ACJAR7_001316 [Polaromonas sp.]
MEAKFHGLSDPVLGADQTAALLKASWTVGQAANVSALIQLATTTA